ncbi:hypothetical protein B0H67DRAFT_477717 [Lasiosphaeris hirsuta]|uniref:Rhodopsin domain-containing protein n=1 Tax=Lasiosphaeris hirsuta TaxID=260670 RepID=A0AA40ECE8_9PEZI|nr:hypothetical protein B0H67DRAFT_477717 [Lasiosphaeris hirsuta]
MSLPGPLIETWVLYTFGSLVILARIACRWRMIGIANFKPDDYLIIPAWITYTTMTVAAHIVGGHGDLHALSLEEREALASGSPGAADPLVTGTKWFCAGVATYVTFIWLLKLNMLFLYQRVVRGLWVARFIRPAMALVGGTYLATLLVLFLPCRPYDRMWIVFPDQGAYCKPQSTLNLIPPLAMNLLTDLVIMAIPAPVILPIHTTLARKAGLLTLFFAGVFIMVAAILRVVFVIVMADGPTAAIWSCREDFVAIVVGQAILLRPVFTRGFWGGKGEVGKSIGVTEEGTGSGRRVKDPFSVTVALATVGGDESRETVAGSDAEMGGAGLVISVKSLVEVESTESPTGRDPGRGDCLWPTNRASCWNGREGGV